MRRSLTWCVLAFAAAIWAPGSAWSEADDGKAEAQDARVKKLIADGGYYYSAGQFEKAMAAADRALELKPDSAPAKQLREMSAEALKVRGARMTPTEGERDRQAKLDAIARDMQVQRDVLVLPEKRAEPKARWEDSKDEGARAATENREIDATLDGTTVSVDFAGTTLKDVAAFLATSGKVNVQVDPRARVGDRSALDAEVTFKAKDIKLRNAVTWIARLSGLTWTVRDQVVFITDAEHIEELMVTAVYDIRDIVQGLPDYSSVPEFDMTLPAVNARRISDGFYRVPQWWLWNGQAPWTGAYFVDFAERERQVITEDEVRELVDELLNAEDEKAK